MNVIRKVNIIELNYLHPAWYDGYRYDAQMITSVDGGETFWHCGVGKFCKTKEEAEEYRRSVEENAA